MTNTEKAQEQDAAISNKLARVDISDTQMSVYLKLNLKDTLDDIASKGFNQQLKGAVSSALTSERNTHSKAVQYGNKAAEKLALDRIAELTGFQNLLK